MSLSFNQVINPPSLCSFSLLNLNVSPGRAITTETALTRPNLAADTCPNLSV